MKRVTCNPYLFILASTLALAVNIPAYAGVDSSGGGNAVVCFDNPLIPASIRDQANPLKGEILDSQLAHITSVTMLDLVEASQPHGLSEKKPEIITIGADETSLQYAERIAKRFDHYQPVVSHLIRDGVSRFTDSNVEMEPHGISKIDDSAMVEQIDSVNCVLGTMAAQYTEKDELYLHVDQRLYDKSDNLNRAVMLIHEAIYFHARTLGQTDSRSTRLLLGNLITQNSGITVSALNQKLVSLGFEENSGKAFADSYPVQLLNNTLSDLWDDAQWHYFAFDGGATELQESTADVLNAYGFPADIMCPDTEFEKTPIPARSATIPARLDLCRYSLHSLLTQNWDRVIDRYGQFLRPTLKDNSPNSPERANLQKKYDEVNAFINQRQIEIKNRLQKTYETKWKTALTSTGFQTRDPDHSGDFLVEKFITDFSQSVQDDYANPRILAIIIKGQRPTPTTDFLLRLWNLNAALSWGAYAGFNLDVVIP